MKTILLPGRWQAPGGPHAGHRYLIEKSIKEGNRTIIGIRDIPENEKNPYDVETRMAQFRKLYGKDVEFVTIPEDGDGLEVWYGRGVGWGIKEIEVPKNIQVVSGTNLRKLGSTTIWFTGIPCAGKTTIAKAFKPVLEEAGYNVVHLDGDVLRTGLCAGLGFSDEGRKENLRRVAHVSELLNKNNTVVLASYVSPTEEMRELIGSIVENLQIVHVNASSEVCAERDVKGMWAKAKAGEIKGFTGYDAPFDTPSDPFLTLDTEEMTVEECVIKLKESFGI